MKRYLLVAQTLGNLGWSNVARVGWYRILLRTGLHPVQRIKPLTAEGPHFIPYKESASETAQAASRLNSAQKVRARKLRLFGWLEVENNGDAPDWHANPSDPKLASRELGPWWKIADFSHQTGDIKYIWELSRMDWVVELARQGRAGDGGALEQLNLWLDDWERKNPTFQGVNWKCGQETAIRVMHIAMALMMLDQLKNVSERNLAFLKNHLARIKPTLSYAQGQSNNHATSEATALYIGGLILSANGDAQGATYSKIGRDRLYAYVMNLFEEDGSFSQYSANYHRVALDSLSLVEVFRLYFSDEAFSGDYNARVRAATDWLAAMIVNAEGNVPIFGHNDGANLLALSLADYSDNRPSVQLASHLFHGRKAFPEGAHDEILNWFGLIESVSPKLQQTSVHFQNGGVVILKNVRASALFRYPKFKFRPSQSDALHIDLWVDGENILRDGGTFSYNSTPEITNYFGGVESHNSVQLDGRDQMPRLSRFLLGAWLRADQVDVDLNGPQPHAAAAYKDYWGGQHHRKMELLDDRLIVTDQIAGVCKDAILRWRLPAGDWKLSGNNISNGVITINVMADNPIKTSIMVGKESRYYGQMQDVSVMEVSFKAPSTLTSTIIF